MEDKKEIMEFPTIFRLRVIGWNEDDFATFVMVGVRKHVPEMTEDSIHLKPSNGGKYLAVTAAFVAESREQLDAVYREVSGHERVLWFL